MGESNKPIIIEAQFFTEGIIPEAHSTIKAVEELTKEQKLKDKKEGLTEEEQIYGHAARVLVQKMYFKQGQDEEVQRHCLRETALRLIQKHGKQILDVMRPELKEALGLQDVEQTKK